MVLSIKPSETFLFDVFIENKSFFSMITFNDKVQIFNNSINKLESDIKKIALEHINTEYYNFFWEFTYDIHRDDGIKDTVADYYLLEIIKYVKKHFNVKKVEVYSVLSMSVIEKISEALPIELKISPFFKIKEYIRYQIGPLKYINKYLFKALSFKIKEKEIKRGGVLIFTNDRFNISRMKEFPKMLNKRFDIYYLNFSLTKLIEASTNTEIEFKSYSISFFFKSLFKTFNFYSYFRKSIKRDNNKTLYSLLLFKQSFLQSFYLFLRYNALDNLFKNYHFDYIVTNTTIADPAKRMFTYVANRNNIKTIVFACRPFLSYLRVEDRVLNLDFNQKNRAFFADYFILFDKVSKKHLSNFGVADDKMIVYNEETNNQNKLNIIKDGIFLLFASSPYNEKLINLFISLKNEGVKLGNIYYREHPNRGLTNMHKSIFQENFINSVCLNDYSWGEMFFENIIAFSSNSTSAIEASSRGAAIIWLPYLTDQSLQFKPMMEVVGMISYSFEELLNFMKTLTDEGKKEFIKRCNEQYQNNIYEKSSVKKFIEEM